MHEPRGHALVGGRLALRQHVGDSVLEFVEPTKDVIVPGFKIQQYLKLTKRRIHAEDSLGVELTSAGGLLVLGIGKRASRRSGFWIDAWLQGQAGQHFTDSSTSQAVDPE
jgi:hypothetical protein